MKRNLIALLVVVVFWFLFSLLAMGQTIFDRPVPIWARDGYVEATAGINYSDRFIGGYGNRYAGGFFGGYQQEETPYIYPPLSRLEGVIREAGYVGNRFYETNRSSSLAGREIDFRYATLRDDRERWELDRGYRAPGVIDVSQLPNQGRVRVEAQPATQVQPGEFQAIFSNPNDYRIVVYDFGVEIAQLEPKSSVAKILSPTEHEFSARGFPQIANDRGIRFEEKILAPKFKGKSRWEFLEVE